MNFLLHNIPMKLGILGFVRLIPKSRVRSNPRESLNVIQNKQKSIGKKIGIFHFLNMHILNNHILLETFEGAIMSFTT